MICRLCKGGILNGQLAIMVGADGRPSVAVVHMICPDCHGEKRLRCPAVSDQEVLRGWLAIDFMPPDDAPPTPADNDPDEPPLAPTDFEIDLDELYRDANGGEG